MKLRDLMQLIAYDVWIMLRDGNTNELISITYANMIKTDERFNDYNEWNVFQIVPVNENTLKVVVIK